MNFIGLIDNVKIPKLMPYLKRISSLLSCKFDHEKDNGDHEGDMRG